MTTVTICLLDERSTLSGGGKKRVKKNPTPPNPLFLTAVQNKNRAHGILCIGHLQYSAAEEYLSKESSVQTEILTGRISVNGSTVSLYTVLGWQ